MAAAPGGEDREDQEGGYPRGYILRKPSEEAVEQGTTLMTTCTRLPQRRTTLAGGWGGIPPGLYSKVEKLLNTSTDAAYLLATRY